MRGAGIVVVHPIETRDKRVQKEMNLDYYPKLEPFCRQYGIKLGIENMILSTGS